MIQEFGIYILQRKCLHYCIKTVRGVLLFQYCVCRWWGEGGGGVVGGGGREGGWGGGLGS